MKVIRKLYVCINICIKTISISLPNIFKTLFINATTLNCYRRRIFKFVNLTCASVCHSPIQRAKSISPLTAFQSGLPFCGDQR